MLLWTSKAVAASQSGSAIENMVFCVYTCVCVGEDSLSGRRVIHNLIFYITFFSYILVTVAHFRLPLKLQHKSPVEKGKLVGRMISSYKINCN